MGGLTDADGLIPLTLQKGRVSVRGVEKSGGTNNQAGAGGMPMQCTVGRMKRHADGVRISST